MISPAESNNRSPDELSISEPSIVMLSTTTPALAVTTPDTLKAPVTFNGLFMSQLVVAWVYSKVAEAPPIVIPAPLAAAESAASVAIEKFKSSIDTVVELTVVVVPSTCRLPAMTTVPVLSPCVAGSSVNVAGPRI